MFAMYKIPLDWVRRLAPLFYLFALLSLILVFSPLGVTVNGARRWINLGFLRFQPTEALKYCLVLILAWWYDRESREAGTFIKGALCPAIIMGIGLLLAIAGKDLGTPALIAIVGGAVCFAAGMKIKYLIIGFLFSLALAYYYISHEAYRVKRLLAFLNPAADPLGAGYQNLQALMAICSAGDLVDCEKGVFSLGRAFEISDNDGLYNAARIAYNDKMDDFYKGLEKMGLQEDLDIEVANAKTPILRSKTLTRADFKNVTHGYSVAVPPIYMLAYYNAIANHGVYVRPRLIKAIQSPEGKIEMTNPVVVKEKICSQKTIEKVRGCLERVVMYGTARRIRDDNYFNQLKDSTIQARPLIAGKTGTAFIYDEKTRQYSNVKNSSFIGYFPADNPKYTCMVLIKGTTLDAGYVSAPACKVIAEKLVTNLNEFDINNKRNIYNVPTCRVGYFQDLALIYDQLGIKADYKGKNDYVMVERSEDKTGSVLFVPVAQGQQIPSMRGMTAKDAAYLLKKKGYQVCLKGRGKVSTISISGKTANVYLTND